MDNVQRNKLQKHMNHAYTFISLLQTNRFVLSAVFSCHQSLFCFRYLIAEVIKLWGAPRGAPMVL
jgi:hypothetical protein